MALVKIKDVYLYVGPYDSGSESHNIVKLLVDNEIEHTVLAYNDVNQHASVFDSLNTWRWGPDKEQKVLTKFPLVHWTECYSDFTTELFCVTSLTELNNSSLIANKELVE
jgi:hypothetical protein